MSTAAAAVRTRVAAALGGAGVVLVAWATPAGADPPRPTNDRSEVVAVQPALPSGVEVRVVGGDAFLELVVAPGHRVEVPDYGSTERGYLRVAADGTVERNRNAVATTANEERYGTGDAVDPDAPESWEVVARGGRYAWHDHRIHWMARTDPPVDDDGLIDLGGPDGRWEVALVVDGAPTTVQGELRRLAAPSPLPWALLAIGSAAAVGWVAIRTRRWRAALAAAAGTGALAVAASLATYAAAPAGSGAPWWPVAVAAATAAAGLAGALGPAAGRLAAGAAAAAGLLAWGVLRLGVLVHAVLPTTAPPGLDRAATALAIGVGAALAAGLLWQPPAAGSAAR